MISFLDAFLGIIAAGFALRAIIALKTGSIAWTNRNFDKRLFWWLVFVYFVLAAATALAVWWRR